MRRCFRWLGALLLALCAGGIGMAAHAEQPGGEIAWALHSEPRTFDPARVDDQSSETVRYLTGGVLLRVNRVTQQTEAALAERWTVSADGRTVLLQLREGLRFSDGSALTAADVVASLRRTLDPATGAPVREEFVQPAAVVVTAAGQRGVRIQLPQRLVALGKILDEIAIEPAAHFGDSRVTAGPFRVESVKAGECVLLRRNPFYWKKDGAGRSLPYLETVRMDIVSNRERERLAFARGQYEFIDNVPAEDYDDLAKSTPGARDLGPSLNTEQMWFNQASWAPLPAFEKAWFANVAFRQAVSMAIHRGDLARIAYRGHATPAYSFVSPANGAWYNRDLRVRHEDPRTALTLLEGAGFRMAGRQLVDAAGNPVRFSILTNAGNRAREKMAALIQQDLAALGMQVSVVRLDFPALVDRLMHTAAYEAALLGLSNVDPDPNGMMNVWMSGSPNHQWNPSEKTPATEWEAEVDRLMQAQAALADPRERKQRTDRVQQIVADQQPFIYLVYPNLLYAVSPVLEGVRFPRCSRAWFRRSIRCGAGRVGDDGDWTAAAGAVGGGLWTRDIFA